MRRLAVLLLAFLALGLGGTSVCNAAVRHYEKLSAGEQIALQLSEARIVKYDQELTLLERERRDHRISTDDYKWKSTTLVFYIQQESLYQNSILVRRSDFPQRAEDVLETMEHGLLIVPVGVGCVVAACPQVLEFLTMIH